MTKLSGMFILILTYLAQKDLSGGATPSPSPFSPPAMSSENTGVLFQKFDQVQLEDE